MKSLFLNRGLVSEIENRFKIEQGLLQHIGKGADSHVFALNGSGVVMKVYPELSASVIKRYAEITLRFMRKVLDSQYSSEFSVVPQGTEIQIIQNHVCVFGQQLIIQRLDTQSVSRLDAFNRALNPQFGPIESINAMVAAKIIFITDLASTLQSSGVLTGTEFPRREASTRWGDVMRLVRERCASGD
jgi:hypothetical protein